VELDELQAETARLSNWAHLATVGADGNPDVVPVWPAWQEGVLWINSHAHSVKVRNLAANPNVAMHWQVDESGDGVEVWAPPPSTRTWTPSAGCGQGCSPTTSTTSHPKAPNRRPAASSPFTPSEPWR
jgi:Pyridoxamine 5'-phosphate oxidase